MFTKLLNKLFLYSYFNFFNGNFPSYPFSSLVFLLLFWTNQKFKTDLTNWGWVCIETWKRKRWREILSRIVLIDQFRFQISANFFVHCFFSLTNREVKWCKCKKLIFSHKLRDFTSWGKVLNFLVKIKLRILAISTVLWLIWWTGMKLDWLNSFSLRRFGMSKKRVFFLKQLLR